MHRLPATVLLAGALLAVPAVRASDTVRFDGLDPEIYDWSRESVMQLLCFDAATGRHYLSRAVVLDTRPRGGRDAHDILLATRHAIDGRSGRRSCRIRGVPEMVGEIVDARTGTPDAAHTNDFGADWAILRTRGRLPQDVPAYACDGV